MTATVPDLGARALRKLGWGVVPTGAGAAAGAAFTRADVVALVLQQQGIPVPDEQRPAGLPPVAETELADRVAKRVGINPAGPGLNATGGVLTQAAIATGALLRLAVVYPEETPPALVMTAVMDKVEAVHDGLVETGLAIWPISAVPAQVAQQYIIMVAALAAPVFGKSPLDGDFAAAREGIRRIALAGSRGQAMALAKVEAAHEALNVLGVVSWPVTAVPAAYAEDYVAMAAALLAPVMGQVDPALREASTKEYEMAVGHIRRGANVATARVRAQRRVGAVLDEMAALGLSDWAADAIPGAVADAVVAMTAAQQDEDDGKDASPNAWAAQIARVRRIVMSGPRGQALAEQKVRAVHSALDAEGRTRWSLFDLPDYAEEPYVMKAAFLLAPELGERADPAWEMLSDRALARMVTLTSRREPVVGCYF